MVVSISEKCVDYENKLLTRTSEFKALFRATPIPNIFNFEIPCFPYLMLVLLNI